MVVGLRFMFDSQMSKSELNVLGRENRSQCRKETKAIIAVEVLTGRNQGGTSDSSAMFSPEPEPGATLDDESES